MLDITRAYGLDFLFPARDTVVGRCLRDRGEFARPEMEILNRLVQLAGPCTFIDVGANIGSVALPIAARNRNSNIVAIEGNRRMAMVLSANALMNGLENVDVHHAVAGGASGIIRFPSPSLSDAINFGEVGVSSDSADGAEAVRMCSLDELAPASTRVIKIDVEGFELEVLEGAKAVLAQHNVSWVIEHKSDECSTAVCDVMLKNGYKLFWLFAPFITPRSAKNMDTSHANIQGDTNVLAIPDGEPPVPMMQIRNSDDVRPGSIDGYPYLKAFGF